MLNSKTLGLAIPFGFLGAVFLLFCGSHRIKILIGTLFFSTVILVGSIGTMFTAKGISYALPNYSYPTESGGYDKKLGQSEKNFYSETLSIIKRSAILSLVHRTYIWEYSANQIKKKPFHGWGLAASRYIGNEEIMVDKKREIIGELLPLHSHNFALQVWMETGLVGYIIFLTLIYIILSKADRLLRDNPLERVFLLTILLIAITLWYLNYGAWTSWWLHQLGFIITMTIISLQNTDLPSIAHETR